MFLGAFLALAGAAGAGGQEKAAERRAAPPDIEPLTTPDGSRFLLVPRPGRPVVFWATFTAMGRLHEARGQEGLAAACARASLDGTRVHGTTNAAIEEEALQQLDRLLAERELATRPGAAPARSGLEAEIVQAIQRARRLGDRLAWRRLVAALPAQQPSIEVMVEGTLLTTAVSSTRLAELAQLLESRQRDAVLRGFHDALAEARQDVELAAAAVSSARREALQLAIGDHPVRTVLRPPAKPPRHVSRAEGLDFWRRHALPDRTLHVLVGDLDPVRASDLLRKTFEHQADPSLVPVALPDEPAVAAERSARLPGGEPRLVCAWRLPAGVPLAELETVALLLAGGPSSELTGPLKQERNLTLSIVALPSFPSLARPALFVLDVEVARTDDYASVEEEILTRLERLRREGATPAQIARARSDHERARRLAQDAPADLAADLAHRVAAGFGADLQAPTAEAIALLLPRLLAPTATTRVGWEPPPEPKQPAAVEKQPDKPPDGKEER